MIPCSRRSTLPASMSTQTTSCPTSARQVPVTRPTYPVPKMLMRIRLFRLLVQDVEEFHLEHQRAARGDRATRRTHVAVAELAGQPEHVLAADRHQLQAFLPARDHARQREHGGLAAVVGAVEHGAVDERAAVVHADAALGTGLRALALLEHLVLQARCGDLDAFLAGVPGQERFPGLA